MPTPTMPVVEVDDDDSQQATQSVADARRVPGAQHRSGLSGSDPWNVICVLHPSSQAAFDDVAQLAEYGPQHLLRQPSFPTPSPEDSSVAKALSSANMSRDIALRFDSSVNSPHMGFVFGRNPMRADIIVGDNESKRVSNTHFRIFLNKSGVLMIQDTSTNGTVVGDIYLKKGSRDEKRMLLDGSLVRFAFEPPEHELRFNVRIPSREGYEEQYQRALDEYLQRIEVFEEQEAALNAAAAIPIDAAIGAFPRPPLGGNETPRGFKMPAVKKQRNLRSRVQPSQWKGGEKYNVIEVAGKGAFSTVYKVATKAEGELFAAKELSKRNVIKDGMLDASLDKEIRILERIDHPNIVKFIECINEATSNNIYIIMEYVPCGDLGKYIQDNQTMPEPMVQEIARQTLHGLSYLHSLQITHRDIKPDNILLMSEDPVHVKISDFGLAKVITNNDSYLKTFCGTLLYLAPEVFPAYTDYNNGAGSKRRRTIAEARRRPPPRRYGQSVDMWSFGCVLYALLCGSPPFTGQSKEAIFEIIMSGHLDVRPLVAADVSELAIDFIRKLLNILPELRPSEIECLRDPWLYDGAEIVESSEYDPSQALDIIEEEDEEGLDASRLDLRDEDYYDNNAKEETDTSSVELDKDDSPTPKRVKVTEMYNYRSLASARSSSPEESYHAAPFESHAAWHSRRASDGGHPLKSSGLLGRDTPPTTESGRSGSPGLITLLRRADMMPLTGAESMVGNLKVASSPGPPSPASTPPHRRTVSRETSPAIISTRASSLPVSKRGVFDRMIRLDPPAILEEAVKSLIEEVVEAAVVASQAESSPPTQIRVQAESSPPTQIRVQADTPPAVKSEPLALLEPNLPIQSSFARPLTPWGKLVPMSGSFLATQISLTEKMTSYGRASTNTALVDPSEVRVPRFAFAIEKSPSSKIVCISTLSRQGIWINGVRLSDKDEQGDQLWGRLYHGDEITVFRDARGHFLSFRVEFFGDLATPKRLGKEKFRFRDTDAPPSSQEEDVKRDLKAGNIKIETIQAVTQNMVSEDGGSSNMDATTTTTTSPRCVTSTNASSSDAGAGVIGSPPVAAN